MSLSSSAISSVRKAWTIIQSYPPLVLPEKITKGASARYFFNPSILLLRCWDVLNVISAIRITRRLTFFVSTDIVYPVITPLSSSLLILDSISFSLI